VTAAAPWTSVEPKFHKRSVLDECGEDVKDVHELHDGGEVELASRHHSASAQQHPRRRSAETRTHAQKAWKLPVVGYAHNHETVRGHFGDEEPNAAHGGSHGDPRSQPGPHQIRGDSDKAAVAVSGGGVCPRGDGEGNEVAEGHGRQRPAHGFGKRAGGVAAVPTEGRRTVVVVEVPKKNVEKRAPLHVSKPVAAFHVYAFTLALAVALVGSASVARAEKPVGDAHLGQRGHGEDCEREEDEGDEEDAGGAVHV